MARQHAAEPANSLITPSGVYIGFSRAVSHSSNQQRDVMALCVMQYRYDVSVSTARVNRHTSD